MPSIKGRYNLQQADPIAHDLVDELKPYCGNIAICGSIRRKRPFVGDIDLIVADPKPGFADRVISYGSTYEPNTLKFAFFYKGVAVDVLIVEQGGWGAAMMHSTGPVKENIRMRAIAKRHGLTLSQYGLFNENGTRVAGKTEEEVYNYLGVSFVDPESRDFDNEKWHYKGRA